MKDNKPSEEQAESLIKHHLIKYGFNVVKPSFDIEPLGGVNEDVCLPDEYVPSG